MVDETRFESDFLWGMKIVEAKGEKLYFISFSFWFYKNNFIFERRMNYERVQIKFTQK
jgi:hypothetical protein